MEIEEIQRPSQDDQHLEEYQAEPSLSPDVIVVRQELSGVAVIPRHNAIFEYLTSAPVYQEYEEVFKNIGYVFLAILCILVAIGYVYSQPGTGMHFKWRRSMRKLRRLSKNVLPSLKESAAGVYPVIKDVVNIVYVILNHMFE